MKKTITDDEFKSLLTKCTTQGELDEELKNHVLVWFKNPELDTFIYQQRGRIIREYGKI